MKSVNAEYPLSCRKCVKKTTKKRNLQIRSPARAPKCLAPPQKWYHHIAQPSAHLKPPSLEKESPLLHQEKNDFLKGLYFGISTRTALESPKSDMCQIWPERVLGHVISCLESKFEKRIPMGSVLNEQKEILMCDPIRWFNPFITTPLTARGLTIHIIDTCPLAARGPHTNSPSNYSI